MASDIALVLSGGNALGAYQAGACTALLEAGLSPDWVSGGSTGAVHSVLIGGNPPERRVAAIREFWDRAAHPDFLPGLGAEGRRMHDAAAAAGVMMFGRPGLFNRRPPLLDLAPGGPETASPLDQTPLGATVAQLADFDRLGREGVRVTICAVDTETGEEVAFDTERDRLTPQHVLASSAFLGLFAPVRLDGRWLCDAGFSANLPMDPILDEPRTRDLLCFAIDLFPGEGAVPHNLPEAGQRAQELLLASQARRGLRRQSELLRLRARLAAQEGRSVGRVTIVHLGYVPEGHAAPGRILDFSASSVRDRWAGGVRDMQAALEAVEGLAPTDDPVRVVKIRRGAVAAIEGGEPAAAPAPLVGDPGLDVVRSATEAVFGRAGGA
ncbi:MAG TPA: patatin-like phospholipase family protein [Alphaproteobacteria bacterium]|nr:patatin-like phospholipase family protein [Alphaproteobacteria bacterium]